MDKYELRNLARQSAEQYFDYLVRTDKGLIITDAVSINAISYKKKKGMAVYRIGLEKRLRNLDMVYLRIDNKDYSEGGIELLLYDDDKRDLLVAVSPTTFSEDLSTFEPERVKVISDMRYLVERMGKWFGEKQILLPTSKCVNFNPREVGYYGNCSEEQKDAICFALTTPFSYVWGAPGTGKTKYVLSNCVMNYLARDEKVFVIAPTNNAVEQALSSIIELSDIMGVPRKKLLRLGAPTKDFADKYPDVCEIKEINGVMKTKEEKKEFLSELLQYRDKRSQFVELKNNVLNELDTIEWKVANGIIHQSDTNQLAILLKDSLIARYVKLDQRNPAECVEKTRIALALCEKDIDEDGELYSSYKDDTESEIKEKLDTLVDSILDNKAKVGSKRMSEAKVIASTIDTFIGMFSDEENESQLVGTAHIFLDEAGYTSIAKALALFSRLQQITFFGDHFQLPPVCEMDDVEMATSKEVCLWAQSAIYIGDMLDESLDETFNKYIKGEMPKFAIMPKIDLSVSYRFGQNLLDVLADNVYDEHLKSVENKENLIVEFINAPKQIPPSKKRENQDEVIAIRAWLKAQGYSKKRSQSVAILTPYKNQVALLKKHCFGFVGDEIYSVHGSQGREWDTVIFSVCDTEDKYFVDSQSKRSKGKLILNTALSRAKKRLVIVCDYRYWSNQKEQLISELLAIATNTMLT